MGWLCLLASTLSLLPSHPAGDYLPREEFWGNPRCFQGAPLEGRAARSYLWCCMCYLRAYLGHPECWSGDEPQALGLSFERCCLVEPEGEAADRRLAVLAAGGPEPQAKPSPGEIALGLWGGELWGMRHIDLQMPFLSRLITLQGCDSEVWDEILFAFRIKGGCLSCSTPQGDLLRYFSATREGCVAGQLVLALSSFLATPEGTLGEPPEEALRERVTAEELLQAVEADLLAAMHVDGIQLSAVQLESLFFDIFGVTPTQIRYVLHHTWLGFDYPPIFDYVLGLPTRPHQDRGSTQYESSRLLWDLGMSGGMDSLYYLVHGFRVLSVEANPMLALDVTTALKRYGDKVQILAAAITSETSSDDSLEANDLLITEPNRREVMFHIHRERPDFSAIDDDRVPKHMLAGTVPVRAVTCSELVQEYGRPFGVKIDAEGADKACLASLKAADAVPRYLSTEVPNLVKEGAEAAQELVKLLSSMGYSGFKLVRQMLYNARTVMAVNQQTNLTEISVSRQGLGLGASGPFGEAAVDWLAGPRWRSAEEVLTELLHGGPVWASSTGNEWFDLHARLPE